MQQYTRRRFLSAAAAGVSGAAAGFTLPMFDPLSLVHAATNDPHNAADKKMNVLFIAVDDLRPQLGCYGQTQMITPNIDRIAARGMVFKRAYCQSAICGPSRASLLTGLRPDTSGIVRNAPPVRKVLPDLMTLPRLFKSNGYYTGSLGKIYHSSRDDNAHGWTDRAWRPEGNYALAENQAIMDKYVRRRAAGEYRPPRGPLCEAAEVADEAYPDGQTAAKAIEVLNRVKDQPFFLAVGFVKPHMPFACPKQYWDMYPARSIKLADNDFLPQDCPEIAPYNYDEMRAFDDIDNEKPLTEQQKIEATRGYYACTTFADAQVGKVLDELERLGLSDNTIVVLFGDHGWHLGENAQWGKHTNFEQATHSPLIVSVPGMKNAGQSTAALTEFVDIYPTLADLCGLEKPDHLEGWSMRPLLEDPQRAWKSVAFSQVIRWSRGMGYTIRTERYRYMRWHGPGGEVVGREVYDHAEDPQENVNLANRSEYAHLVKKLDAQLEAGWREALPAGL